MADNIEHSDPRMRTGTYPSGGLSANPGNAKDWETAFYRLLSEFRSAMLRRLAGLVCEAHLRNGARLNDATDFKAWLLELAQEAEKCKR
jgi:hypothetical protein